MFDQTIISDDIYIRLGRSGYVYISSVSQKSMVPIAPSEVPALSAFLVSYLAVPRRLTSVPADSPTPLVASDTATTTASG